jgi:hypothetical protein
VSVYVDAGPYTQGAYVIRVSVLDQSGQVVEPWNGTTLSEMAKLGITNEYQYSLFKPTQYGFVGGVGAPATIALPHQGSVKLQPGNYQANIAGHRWNAVENQRSAWHAVSFRWIAASCRPHGGIDYLAACLRSKADETGITPFIQGDSRCRSA